MGTANWPERSRAEVAGPGLAGVLVEWITAPMAILFDAVSFLFSAVFLSRIREPEPPPVRRAQPHLGREIAEGLRGAWNDPLLRAMAGRTLTAPSSWAFQAACTSCLPCANCG